MVERLKDAIEKARREREDTARRETPVPVAQPTPPRAVTPWERLSPLDVDTIQLDRARVVTAAKSHPAHISFDVLRTRLLKVCRDNGWRRIAVTSPSKGCGKSFVCANLAFSLARNPQLKIALVDLDLRSPRLAKMLGARGPKALVSFIDGAATLTDAVGRVSANLAMGLNDAPVRNSAELLQSPSAGAALGALTEELALDVVLVDLPPMLVSDDVLATLPHVDALLLVIGAGLTTAAEVRECERLLGESTPFLGVVLNKVDEADMENYEAVYAGAPVSA